MKRQRNNQEAEPFTTLVSPLKPRCDHKARRSSRLSVTGNISSIEGSSAAFEYSAGKRTFGTTPSLKCERLVWTSNLVALIILIYNRLF